MLKWACQLNRTNDFGRRRCENNNIEKLEAKGGAHIKYKLQIIINLIAGILLELAKHIFLLIQRLAYIFINESSFEREVRGISRDWQLRNVL